MDYKLKNRDGAETTYTKEKLKIPAATGEDMVVFTQGEAQAEKTIDIAENGTFSVEPDAGYAFVKKVSGTVAVPTPEPVLQEKSVELTANGQTTVAPDAGKDGLSKVDITVAVPTPDLQKKTISITANGSGSVLPDDGKDGLSEVDYTVNVPTATLEEKEIDITEKGLTEISPSDGYTGMSNVSAWVDVPMVVFNTNTRIAFSQAITDAVRFYDSGDYSGFVQAQSGYGGQGIPFAVNLYGSMTWGTMRAYITDTSLEKGNWEWWSAPVPDAPNYFEIFHIFRISGTFISTYATFGHKYVPDTWPAPLNNTQLYTITDPESTSEIGAVSRNQGSGLINFNYDAHTFD